jgi:tRNA dimethylallyltransferase
MAELLPLLVVVGPTASGKTELAMQLCERQGGEIVSADSVQVYRHFDIGTAKPSSAERARARHHLIDIADPTEPLDAARWAELADHAVRDIIARGKLPVVCGGTFLWVRALLYGLTPAPPASEALRLRHRELVAEHGRAKLHQELAAIDPLTAARLAPNDFVRVSRALEVYELTRVPMSRWQEQHGFRTARYAPRLVGLEHSRDQLDQRIAARVDRMLALGLRDEVRSLIARGFADTRAMGSVGYKQVRLAEATATPEPGLRDAIVRATRIFARRQRTWLREQPVQWVTSSHEVSA